MTTPGPWKATYELATPGARAAWRIHHDYPLCQSHVGECYQAGDALLMAAAPSMLWTLRRIRLLLIDNGTPDNSEEIELIDAAIAKATATREPTEEKRC